MVSNLLGLIQRPQLNRKTKITCCHLETLIKTWLPLIETGINLWGPISIRVNLHRQLNPFWGVRHRRNRKAQNHDLQVKTLYTLEISVHLWEKEQLYMASSFVFQCARRADQENQAKMKEARSFSKNICPISYRKIKKLKLHRLWSAEVVSSSRKITNHLLLWAILNHAQKKSNQRKKNSSK